VVKLPDGYPGRVRVTETELCDDGLLAEEVVSATLSIEGVRALREFIARLQGRVTGSAP
jgi:hypothetical protein